MMRRDDRHNAFNNHRRTERYGSPDEYKRPPTSGREPLSWNTAMAKEAGNVRVEVNTAVTPRLERLYSFTLTRVGANNRPSRYFHAQDIQDLMAVVRETGEWVREQEKKTDAPPPRPG